MEMKPVRAQLVTAEAKDARGHGSNKLGAGDQSTAHKGYYIKHNPIRDEAYITKDGQHISTHKSVADAKDTIDKHLTSEGSEDEGGYSFAGRAAGMRPGSDVYEREGLGEERDEPLGNTGAWTVGNRTDKGPFQQAVRATLVTETPGDESEEAGSGLAAAQVMRNGTFYPDKHPDSKHPADDAIAGGMGNHVHPSGDGGRYHDGNAGGGEADVSNGASGEISDLIGEDERAVHHDKGLAGKAPKHGDELPENPAEPTDDGSTKPVQAEWYTGGDEPESPHADDEKAHDVPTASFVDDVRRKLSIKRVMPGGAGQDMKDQPPGQKADEQEGADDGVDKDQRGVPVPNEPVWSKEETNYRYASDPQRSCGDCRFFIEPAGCKLVMGMILKTDTCDKFEPEKQPGDTTVRASIATEAVREAWTDEARAASAAARTHGYKVKNKDNYGTKLQHADGHQLEIRRDGNWTHREMSPAGAFVGRASGVSSENLENRLRDLHGPVGQKTGGSLYVTDKAGRSTGSLKRQYADQDRAAGVVGKRRDNAVKMSEAWSDEARAAAALARKNGYGKVQKDPMMSRAGSLFKHPDGHTLRLFGDASFTHNPSLLPGKTRTDAGAKSRMSGSGPKDLQKVIDAVHVKKAAESQSGGRGKIGKGTTVLGNQRQVPQTGKRVPGLGFAKDEAADGGPGKKWGMAAGGTGYQGMREYSPDQPRDRGRFTKGGGSSTKDAKTTNPKIAASHDAANEYKAKLDTLRQKNEPKQGPGERSAQQGRGISQDEGRQIFQKAGAARGYKENTMREAWSDEARAAAKLARQHGYQKIQQSPRSDGYKHADGHVLKVNGDGSWSHREFGGGSKQGGGYSAGRDSTTLGDKLRDVHGPSPIDKGIGRREGAMREAGKLPFYATHKNGEAIGMSRLQDIKRGMEAIGYDSPLGEVAPPGWEGTVKAMKKGKGIDNPYALAWYMKGKGYQPHKEVGNDLFGVGDPNKRTVRQGQLAKGKDQPLPGKATPGKLHPADQALAKGWNKGDSDLSDRQDDRLGKEKRFEMTQPEGRADSTALGKEERMNKQRVASRGQFPGQRGGKATESDVVERRARKEADVIRRTARRLMRENDYTSMRRVDNVGRKTREAKGSRKAGRRG